MKELKFRAKANLDDEWVYASNIHKVILDDTNEELWVMHPKNEKIEHLGDGYIKYRPLVVNEETIGQYTGFKDINGTEIYEGDLVELRYHRDRRYKVQAKIVNSKEILAMVLKYENDLTTEEYPLYKITANNYLEVVGNIHENGDLLK